MKSFYIKIFVLVTIIFLSINFFCAQSIDAQKLTDQIYQLNDEHKYDQSIILLQEIIDDDKSTSYDKYIAYLNKSFTYKRIYNYTEASTNLELALEEGLKSDKKDEVEARIAVENLFIQFDLQKFDIVDDLLKDIDKYSIGLLDNVTKGHYISLLAIIDLRKNEYESADKKLDQCIDIFERISRKSLPNIYTKKMLVYEALGDHENVVKSYNKGFYYADKYKSDIYRYIMHVNMWRYYKNQNDSLEMRKYRSLADDLNLDNNNAINANTLKLAKLERELVNKKINSKEARIKDTQQYFIISALFAGFGFIILYMLFLKNKKTRKAVELENQTMRNALESLVSEKNIKDETKINLKDYKLTERQIDIINLVKQGKTNKEIGNELFISENTVKYHLKIIYNILEIENRLQLQN